MPDTYPELAKALHTIRELQERLASSERISEGRRVSRDEYLLRENAAEAKLTRVREWAIANLPSEELGSYRQELLAVLDKKEEKV